MADIFISYKREDQDKVRPLAEALNNLGWSVFWDTNIAPGNTFDRLIEAEIDRAKAVIVAWSERSVGSDWVRAEAQYAKERDILVPILLDGVKPPMAYSLVQASPFQTWSGDINDSYFQRLRSRIEELAGPPQSLSKVEERARLEAEARDVWEEIKTSGTSAVIERFIKLYNGTAAAEHATRTLSARIGWSVSKYFYRWPIYAGIVASVLMAVGLEHHYGLPLKYNVPFSFLAFFLTLWIIRLLRTVVRSLLGYGNS